MSGYNPETQDKNFWIKMGGAMLLVILISWLLSSVGLKFLAINGAIGGTVAILSVIVSKYKDRKLF